MRIPAIVSAFLLLACAATGRLTDPTTYTLHSAASLQLILATMVTARSSGVAALRRPEASTSSGATASCSSKWSASRASPWML